MLQKMIRINTLRLIEPATLQNTVDNIKSAIPGFNPHRNLANKNNIANIYTIMNNGKKNPLVPSMSSITKELVEYQTNHCPDTLSKNTYIYLVPTKRWKELFEEFRCSTYEFNAFCEGTTLSFTSIQKIFRDNNTQRPRVGTAKYVSAFLLMKQAEIESYKNYTKAETVNFNPLGAKLQIRELKKQKFWKDMNATKN